MLFVVSCILLANSSNISKCKVVNQKSLAYFLSHITLGMYKIEHT